VPVDPDHRTKETKMHTNTTDRLFAGFGVSFVVLLLVGNGLDGDLHGSLAGRTAQVAAQLAKPIPAQAWAGIYLETLAVGCFLAFASWATTKLGSGVLSQLARLAAGAYGAIMVVSLGLISGAGHRYGHDLTVPVARALDAANTAVYLGSWFLGAFFLLAIGALAVSCAHPRLGWSAISIGILTLIAAPSTDNLGQLAAFLLFIWVAAASVALARNRTTGTPTVTAAQYA
jgi:hypothetical protein